MNVLNQPVLCLNQVWQTIGQKSVKEALVAMLGGTDGHSKPALALDMSYEVAEDGSIDWNNPTQAMPVDWDTWQTLPVRDYDLAIHTSKHTFRCPRFIIQPNYGKMPMVNARPTKDAIRKRDGGICQYTNKVLSWKDSNIDHVIPRAQGGKNTFENMVLSCKEVNSLKADKTPQQAGLRLLRKPMAPKPMPVSAAMTIAQHPSWVYFMDKVTEVRGK